MMPRPMVLVFLLMILIITSQFEWKQQLVSDMESSPIIQKQQQILKGQEVVKEKIILSQEKNIQRLTELVRNLREQLVQCRGSNYTVDGASNSPTANVISLRRKLILD